MLRWQIAAAALVLVSVLTACSDIYRDPCGYVRPDAAPVTTMRTKNKALGYTPSQTTTYGFEQPTAAPRTMGSKCG